MNKLYMISILVIMPLWAIDYNEYCELDERTKQKYVSRYVKSFGDQHNINLKNFEIKGGVSAEHTLKMAVLMEEFYEQFSKIFVGEAKIKRKPEIYIAANHDLYARDIALYTKGQVSAGWSEGMFITYGLEGALFVYKRPEDINDMLIKKVLFHEGTHQLLRSFVAKPIPIWFNEGTATNFETWDMNCSNVHNVNMSLYISDRAHDVVYLYDNKQLRKFSDLSEISTIRWLNSHEPYKNYASAWAAINYLLATEVGRDAFSKMYKSLHVGVDQNSWLSKSTVKKYDVYLEKYISKIIVPHVKYTRKIRKSILGGKGNFELAQKFIKTYPENQEALLYYNWLNFKNNPQDKKSIQVIENLYRKRNSLPDINWALADIYCSLNNKNKAKSYARKMLALDKKHSHATQILNKHL